MILVTGTSGALGRLVHQRLGAGGTDVVAGTRTPRHASAREIDFDRPHTLTSGFAGVDVLVFISAGYAEDDVVLARHGAVVDAATGAGVRHLIYTSLAGSADRLTIAVPHRWTEARLANAPYDVTILRNGLYAELAAGLATAAAESAAASGVFSAPWGDGRMSLVAREDLAEVAARVAAESATDLAAGRRSRHAGRTYELEGVTAISGADLAAILSDVHTTSVRYHPGSLGATRAELAANGLEPYQVGHTISMFSNLNAGQLKAAHSDLPALLDGPPRPAIDLITDTLRRTPSR
ncbi:MAG: NmrA family NAD(P)-binding protein [Micromonosporaceae bacterium]